MNQNASENNSKAVAAVVVAAGKGVRAGTDMPKQYRQLAGQPVLLRTVVSLLADQNLTDIAVVIGAEDAGRFAALGLSGPPIHTVTGGQTRQQSVRAGLEYLAALPAPPGRVLIHDAARPFASADLIARVNAALEDTPAALPVLPLADTMKEIAADGRIGKTVDRSRLVAAQTPQGFRFADILAAHRRAAAEGRDDFTDDAAVAEWAGMPVRAVAGEAANFKITTPDDFARAEAVAAGDTHMETRTAQGFDVHRFADGDHVILGGVRIAHDRALSGHSDADVVLHAITDALYGALCDGDIGTHFPPSDPQWKGADSALFLKEAASRVAARGGSIVHLDATIMCELPKIGPHREAIRESIAAIAGVPASRVSVKATTTERLGFTGRGEGIAAMALATLRLPAED